MPRARSTKSVEQPPAQPTSAMSLYSVALAVLPCALMGLGLSEPQMEKSAAPSSKVAQSPICGHVRIDGHAGPLAEYVNGVYRADPTAPLVNDRLSLQKVVAGLLLAIC